MTRGQVVVPPTPQSRILFAIVIAGLLILAGGIGYWALEHSFHGGKTNPSNPGNGQSFSVGWAAVNESISALPDGPWRLTSALGVAAEIAEAPLPNFGQFIGLNATMRICGNLTGTTVWNSSGIPIFDGSLNSGAAPFWSFLVKNLTGSFLYATSILGAPRVYPAGLSTACIQAAGLSGSGPVNNSITRDTATVASVAFEAAGSQYAARNSPLAQYYVLGSSQLEELDSSPAGWVVNYFRCDLVGIAGLQNYTAVGTTANATSWFVDRGFLTCTPSSFEISFTDPQSRQEADPNAGTETSLPFQVEFPVNGSTGYDGWGLDAWMSQLEINDSAGTALPSSPATCEEWVSSLNDCPSNTTGWFAVLLSANGDWLDSYPSSASQTTWSILNVLISSHDEIVVITPGAWDVPNDTLGILNTPNAPEISGNSAL